MAHKVETMMSVRETPWHGLGKVVTGAPTIPDALRLSGLDWSVRTEPLYLSDGRIAPSKAVVRDSDNAILGAVGPKWTPLQNTAALDWFEPFVSSGACTLETAGSLDSGRVVWVLATITDGGTEVEIAKGDAVRKYLLLSNSHDGSQAVRVGFTPVRVVCWNTLSLSHRDAMSKLLRVKHTQSMRYTLDAIRDTIRLVNAEFQATTEQYRALARSAINRADLRQYVTQLFAADASKPTTREQDKIIDVIDYALAGAGQEDKPLTLWSAYNGVTEYLSWNAGRNADTRLSSLWFGQGADFNSNALKAALALAS